MTLHLVIGASGQIGGHIYQTLLANGKQVKGTYHEHKIPEAEPLNIACANDVDRQISQLSPQVIYLPAAIGNVEYCQTAADETYAVNVLGTANVIRAANKIGAKVVYFSSDYIFDGKHGPYIEDTPANPISEYGRQKVYAEHYVASQSNSYLIVRTTVVYGWEKQRKNFIYRLIENLGQGKAIFVPSDQYGTPTYAPNLAEATIELVELELCGIYNIVGSQIVDRYHLALDAATVFGLDKSLIKPVPTTSLNQKAARPLNAGLITKKAEAVLKTNLLSYQEGLRAMAKEIDHARKQ